MKNKNKDYRINMDTLVIFPYDKKMSRVVESGKEIIIDNKPNNIINSNCMIYGSNISGRLKSTELLTGYSYKAPILVKEDENIIFFPTSSPRQKGCCWVNFNNIDNCYYNITKKISVIKFLDGNRIEINASLNIINNQIFRATRLEHILRKNMFKKV